MGDQLFQQATKGANLDPLKAISENFLVKRKDRGCPEITQQCSALAAMQNVVGVEVAMHDALLVQLPRRPSDPAGDARRGVS